MTMSSPPKVGRGSAAADRIRAWGADHDLSRTDETAVAGAHFADLVDSGLLDLPLPGAGETGVRFDALSAIGEIDLTLARLAEAHTDAVAILAELSPGIAHRPGQRWGVWAAEPPNARLVADRDQDEWRLTGRKAWCSGAGSSSHALVTAHGPDGAGLFAVDLSSRGVRPLDRQWQTAALRGADTRAVDFDGVPAVPVGGPRDYLDRAGFWHGAVGVAAVWYGGAVAIARVMLSAARSRQPDQIGLLHLGAIDTSLAAAHDVLDVAAQRFDEDRDDDTGLAAVIARRARATVEAAVERVIDGVGHALGPGPLATDRDHARRVADLQLYVRQSHAERDLADLGRRLLDGGVEW